MRKTTYMQLHNESTGYGQRTNPTVYYRSNSNRKRGPTEWMLLLSPTAQLPLSYNFRKQCTEPGIYCQYSSWHIPKHTSRYLDDNCTHQPQRGFSSSHTNTCMPTISHVCNSAFGDANSKILKTFVHVSIKFVVLRRYGCWCSSYWRQHDHCPTRDGLIQIDRSLSRWVLAQGPTRRHSGTFVGTCKLPRYPLWVQR